VPISWQGAGRYVNVVRIAVVLIAGASYGAASRSGRGIACRCRVDGGRVGRRHHSDKGSADNGGVGAYTVH
jgi:hypothetical protein